MVNQRTSNISSGGIEALRKMSVSPDTYVDFLKFQGRVFKHNTYVALEFFVQHPNAEFIATREQWEKANYDIKLESKAVKFIDNKGNIVSLYDFSQVEGEIPPYRPTLTARNAPILRNELNLNPEKPLLSEIVNSTLNVSDITDCMKNLGIPPQDFPLFSKSYVNAVQLVISGRLEVGGNRFSLNPDTSAFIKLKSDADRFRFLSAVSKSARSTLLTLENEIIRIENQERNNNYDIRSMEHSDTRAAAASADRGIADDTDRAVREQSDIIESNSQGRGTSLGDNTELERENNESVYSRIQDGELNGSAVSVQTQSVHRDIRTSDGGNGSFDGRGTDRDIGTSMDKVYGEESPDISRGNEISEEVPDSSSLGGQESGRILGDTGQGVRQDESTSDRGLREDTGLGTGETLLHRQHSDEGSNLSSSNRAVSNDFEQNIRNAFSEFYANNSFTENQRQFFDRLETFAINNNISSNLIDSAFEKSHAFSYTYGNRSFLSRKSFGGQLGAFERQLDKAIKSQFGEKVDTNINFSENEVPNNGISQDMIDYVLRSGSNKSNSLERIVSQYEKQKTIESNADFLKNEFRSLRPLYTKYNGLIYENPDNTETLLSVNYADEGIIISTDDAQVTLSWNSASERVGELLENSQFANQNILNSAEAFTRKELAERLWYLHQDVEVEYFIPDYFFTGGFEVSTDKIAEALQGEKPVQEMIDGMNDLIKQYESDRNVLRFHIHNLPQMLSALEDLQLERRKFSAEPNFENNPKYFVSDAEKEQIILSGSNFADSKFRIAAYFDETHSQKDKISFLKECYGTGGTGFDRYNVSFDTSKGIIFKKGSLEVPDTEAIITWSEVADRVTKLIEEDRYITQEDINERDRQLELQKRNDDEISEKVDTNINFSENDSIEEEYVLKIGDRIQLDDGEFEITEITDSIDDKKYQLRDLSSIYPIFRAMYESEIYEKGFALMADSKSDESVSETNSDEPMQLSLDFSEKEEAVNTEAETDVVEAPETLDTVTADEKVDTNINFEPANDSIEEDTQPKKRRKATLEERLYKQFTEMYPEIANGNHTYEHYGKEYDEYGDNDAFEPLSVEYLGDNTYGFMTYYVQNGDLMRDPDFTFMLDNEAKTLTVLEYQLDGVPPYGTYYQRVHDDNGVPDRKLLNALGDNLMQCFKNAESVNRPLTEYVDSNDNRVSLVEEQELKPINLEPEIEPDTVAEITYAERPTDKLRDNIAAIRELQRIETCIENGREPYDENPKAYNSKENSDRLLRRYCGWGGLSQIFDERTSQYASYRDTLRNLLTPEEYNSASESTLNAHYTSQNIIDSMYKAIQNMDLPRNARILEPACGTGNFITRLPSSLGDAEIVGVELDSLTARIAKHLNSHNDNIRIIESGFEKTNLQNDSFDLAIGNVPFGDYNLNDPDYVKDWRIHDAFFRKALDKVAAGGVVAFITSTGTMDKKNPKIREYLAEKAELIGAIRLPNNAFAEAGTKASSDIIFLKKRENPLQPFEAKPDWCYTVPNSDGLTINSYFVSNPQMILGKMEKTTHYDMLTCEPIEGAVLEKQLDEAIKNLNAKISVTKRNAILDKIKGNIEPWGKNFTYQIKDDKVYFRENDVMEEVKCSDNDKLKYKALCELRDTTRQLIDMQKTSVSDVPLIPIREKLNALYDDFKKNYGELSSKTINILFKRDSDYPILRSLEETNKETGKLEKADIFYKRTVNAITEIDSVSSIEEALQVSLDRKGKPDIQYMSVLLTEQYPDTDISVISENVCNELLEKGYIFIDPEKNLPDTPYSGVVERSEYLSGNVRMKLTLAEEYAKTSPIYDKNIEALKTVIPEDIRAEEIAVQMGCAWVDAEDYTSFLKHLSGRTGYYNYRDCDVKYSSVTGEFSITNAGSNKNLNVNESTTYGTKHYNMYQLAEKILNQRRIVAMVEKPHPTDPDRTVTRTDAKETKLALDKAKVIREEFKKWIFDDPDRKQKYERRYNDIFNSLVGREYDGSKLTFPGLTNVNDFTLRPHQKNCVARAIYGGNTLAAHVVGAGKSAVMFSTVMKKKELGLINKACVVVPKPLTEQVANEWRKLYPNARLLTVTNDDLSSEAKRKLFTARVATGSYDAVILSQEQYEKIPMSKEYRTQFMQKELDQLEDILREKASESRGKKDFSVKAIEKAKKQLKARIEKLTDPKAASRAKDDLLEFEQLGFDYLVVDEAHAYKNGFVTTKMTNVAGVTTRPSGRAEDMQMKTDYFNEVLGQGHILFCTGTPVSNSMTELYVMTRYLRPDILKMSGVERFDDWATTFGNVVTKNQQSADGTLKLRTSFAKFANLPELMAMYKEFADVQSADKLNLPRPTLKTGKPQIVKVPATPEQKEYVQELAERAKDISDGNVDPSEDNLLKITGEARLIGLGNKAIEALYTKREQEIPFDFQDNKDSKVDKCIENVAKIYNDTADEKGVQIIFSDIAVNSDNGSFSVYDYIKKELIETYNIPEKEIIFAPKSDSKERENIFKDINNAKYRVVIASTGTLGTGANIQKNLYALHHVDVPWKPSDFEQREGRILRQGNNFKEVEIFNYVTEGTLDSYLYQTVTDKARFIAQLLDDKCPARVSEDCDEKVLTFGEIQAAAEGNPAFKRRIECANEIAELTMLRNDYVQETARMQTQVEKLPNRIDEAKTRLENIKEDKKNAEKLKDFTIKTSDGKTISDKKDINEYLLKMVHKNDESAYVNINSFRVSIVSDKLSGETKFAVKGNSSYLCNAGRHDTQDNYLRLCNLFEKGIDVKAQNTEQLIVSLEENLKQAIERVNIPFTHEQELEDKIQELESLEAELSGLSIQEDDVIDAEETAVSETKTEKAAREKAFENIDDNDIAPTTDTDNYNAPTR